jgi:hypothetical protein
MPPAVALLDHDSTESAHVPHADINLAISEPALAVTLHPEEPSRYHLIRLARSVPSADTAPDEKKHAADSATAVLAVTFRRAVPACSRHTPLPLGIVAMISVPNTPSMPAA